MKVTTIPYRPFNSASRIILPRFFCESYLKAFVDTHLFASWSHTFSEDQGGGEASNEQKNTFVRHKQDKEAKRNALHASREGFWKRTLNRVVRTPIFMKFYSYADSTINRVVVYPVLVLYMDINIFILTADGWKFEILISLFELEISSKFRISNHWSERESVAAARYQSRMM